MATEVEYRKGRETKIFRSSLSRRAREPIAFMINAIKSGKRSRLTGWTSTRSLEIIEAAKTW